MSADLLEQVKELGTDEKQALAEELAPYVPNTLNRRKLLEGAAYAGTGAALFGGGAIAGAESARADPAGELGTDADPIGNVYTRGISIGASTVPNVNIAVYIDGSDAVAVDNDGQVSRGTDQTGIIDTALSHIGSQEVCHIAPGTYSGSTDPVETGAEEQDIIAWGAEIDSTFKVKHVGASVYGLTVNGASGEGFLFTRAQDATYQRLTAENNGTEGFVLADENDAQVARGVFIECFADGNDLEGWLLNGANTNSFCNHNRFYGCDAKNNDLEGWLIEGGANYNLFSACLSESNNQTGGTGAVRFTGSNAENTIVDPFFVSGTNASDSLRFDSGAAKVTILGGRLPDGISDASTQSWFGATNTPTAEVQFPGIEIDGNKITGADAEINLSGGNALQVDSTTNGTNPLLVRDEDGNSLFQVQDGGGIAMDVGSAYSPSNDTTDRTFDANSTSTAELADVLATLIKDLGLDSTTASD